MIVGVLVVVKVGVTVEVAVDVGVMVDVKVGLAVGVLVLVGVVVNVGVVLGVGVTVGTPHSETSMTIVGSTDLMSISGRSTSASADRDAVATTMTIMKRTVKNLIATDYCAAAAPAAFVFAMRSRRSRVLFSGTLKRSSRFVPCL